MGSISRVMAGCFAMSSFAVAIIAGLSGGNPATLILGRALVAMALCYPVGLIVGMICERVIAAHMHDVEQKHPVPKEHQDEPEQEPEAAETAGQSRGEDVLAA
jgi:hypothetical protein